MVLRKQHNKRIFLLILAVLGTMVILAACSSLEAVAPVPTVTPEQQATECPTVIAPTPVSFNDLWKSSAHADEKYGKAGAFSRWDTTNPPEIPVTCAKCHSRTGFLDFLGVDGSTPGQVDAPAKLGTRISCYVCHNEASIILDNVTFSSGERIGGLGREALCINCHGGRASTVAVDDAILKAAAASDDTPSPDLAFINSHSTSGATSFGSEAHGAYEYTGKSYRGRFMRGNEFFSCIQCHNQHTLKVKIEMCGDCHTFDGKDTKNIRVNSTDFDGNGNITEGAYYEVDHIETALYTAIQTYARNVVKVPIAYDRKTHPYFFTDTNNNGKADPEEIKAENKYASWSPRLLRAAYNYNYVAHDAGAYAHNSTYIIQVLYDSLADLGGDTAKMTRP